MNESHHDEPYESKDRAQFQARLSELRREYQLGSARLAEIDRERAHTRDTMLRLSGAIQVLEELLGSGAGESDASQSASASALAAGANSNR